MVRLLEASLLDFTILPAHKRVCFLRLAILTCGNTMDEMDVILNNMIYFRMDATDIYIVAKK